MKEEIKMRNCRTGSGKVSASQTQCKEVNMLKYKVGLLIVLCTLLASLPGPIAAVQAQPEPIKIGLLVPGLEKWSMGAWMEQAAQLAVEHINNAGGVMGHPLSLITRDDRGDIVTAVREAWELVDEENVLAIVEMWGFVAWYVAQEVTIPSRVLLISLTSFYGPFQLQDDDFTFSPYPSGALPEQVLAQYAFFVQGLRRVSILASSEDYSQALATEFEKTFENLGGQAIIVPYDMRQTDFSEEIAKAASGAGDISPEFIVVIPFYDDAYRLITQMIQQGVTNFGLFPEDPLLWYSLFKSVCASLGSQAQLALEGKLGVTHYSFTPPFVPDSPNAGAFLSAFGSRFGKPRAPVYTFEMYDAIFALALAIEDAAMNDVIEAPDMDWIEGRDFFDMPLEHQRLAIQAHLRRVTNQPGDFITVEDKDYGIVGIGESAFGRAQQLIAEGRDINYEGASGRIEFDRYGDNAKGRIGLWTVKNCETVDLVPDLVPVNVTIESELGRGKEKKEKEGGGWVGTPIKFTVTIRNDGNGYTLNSFRVKLTAAGKVEELDVKPYIPPGGTAEVTFSLIFEEKLLPGSYTVEVDSLGNTAGGDISESNENNNTWTGSFTVEDQPPPPLPGYIVVTLDAVKILDSHDPTDTAEVKLGAVVVNGNQVQQVFWPYPDWRWQDANKGDTLLDMGKDNKWNIYLERIPIFALQEDLMADDLAIVIIAVDDDTTEANVVALVSGGLSAITEFALAGLAGKIGGAAVSAIGVLIENWVGQPDQIGIYAETLPRGLWQYLDSQLNRLTIEIKPENANLKGDIEISYTIHRVPPVEFPSQEQLTTVTFDSLQFFNDSEPTGAGTGECYVFTRVIGFAADSPLEEPPTIWRYPQGKPEQECNGGAQQQWDMNHEIIGKRFFLGPFLYVEVAVYEQDGSFGDPDDTIGIASLTILRNEFPEGASGLGFFGTFDNTGRGGGKVAIQLNITR